MSMPPVQTAAATRPIQPRARVAIGMAAWLFVTAALSGCSICQQARRTALYEPLEFSWKLDLSRSLRTYRQWAAAAWRTERAMCPESAGSKHYVQGFEDGFVDYLYAGGDGTPPPIPPRKYWNVAWRSPTGQAAANQWFAGFRRGAQVARDGGYRQQATVISSFRTGMHEDWEAPESLESPAPAEDLGAPSEPLPPPPADAAAPPAIGPDAAGPAVSPDHAAAGADANATAEGGGATDRFRRALEAASGDAAPIAPPQPTLPENAEGAPLQLPPPADAAPADNESP